MKDIFNIVRVLIEEVDKNKEKKELHYENEVSKN